MFDKWIDKFDQTLKQLHGVTKPSHREYPGNHKVDTIATWMPEQKGMSQWQMRINHTGEVCAQALYAGHLVIRLPDSEREWLMQAAREEEDHLKWCQQRLQELNTRPSVLNPIFYAGSFCLGAGFAICGQGWNYGLLAETEDQVSEHLRAQKNLLAHDDLSLAIIEEMIIDEETHAQFAKALQAKQLPWFVKISMRHAANTMKLLVRWF